MGRPQVALRRDHSDHVLAVGRHETTSVASRRHGWLLARPPRHGFVAPFSALPLGQAPTGLALPVVKVLADGTYLSVLINPKIRGARRRAAILAAATGIAEGTGADEDTDVSTELDRPIGKERVTCRHLTSGPELGGLDVSELVGFDESGLLAEVAVDRGAGDAEFVGDLLDGVCALAVGAGLVVHLPGEADLARSEFGFLSAGTSACSGRCQPVERSLGHQRVFKLGDRAQDLEEHPAYGGGGVDALVEHDEVDAAVLELGGQGDEVLRGSVRGGRAW